LKKSANPGEQGWQLPRIFTMTKILMVCMANICRSPMAQAVARQVAHDAGRSQELEFDSAGLLAQHAGERTDARARFVLLSRDYEPGNTRARCVNDQDFEHFDLILAMDRPNLAALQRLCPPQHLGKLHLLLEFAPSAGVDEVPDPYYGNLAGFERVLDLCEAGARGLIKAQAQIL
jgi:protein-tyrosine phosphatase